MERRKGRAKPRSAFLSIAKAQHSRAALRHGLVARWPSEATPGSGGVRYLYRAVVAKSGTVMQRQGQV